MQKIIIVGTIHLGVTPVDELISEIQKHNPDKVLIELSPDESGPEEMEGALAWVRSENLSYALFDVDYPTAKIEGEPSDQVVEQFAAEVSKLYQGHSWKDFNSEGLWEELGIEAADDAFVERYYDTDKLKERDRILVENIKKELVDGTNVIVTGAGHITDFLKAFPEAVAPLRSTF